LIIHSKENAKEAIIYSYNKEINGFAAILEEQEAAQIASQKHNYHDSTIIIFF